MGSVTAITLLVGQIASDLAALMEIWRPKPVATNPYFVSASFSTTDSRGATRMS